MLKNDLRLSCEGRRLSCSVALLTREEWHRKEAGFSNLPLPGKVYCGVPQFP